jgi:hypothetical protein
MVNFILYLSTVIKKVITNYFELPKYKKCTSLNFFSSKNVMYFLLIYLDRFGIHLFMYIYSVQFLLAMLIIFS